MSASIWGLIDGTARFPARPTRYGTCPNEAPAVGYYEGDVPCCGRCGCALEPTGISRNRVAHGWRHRKAPA